MRGNTNRLKVGKGTMRIDDDKPRDLTLSHGQVDFSLGVGQQLE
jgi:hypothetical protein